MKFMELNKSLKENIYNLYNIKGEDSFLIKHAISNIKNAVVADFEEFNYIKIDAEKAKIDEIDAQLSTLPIGSEYRMVVVVNPNAEIVKFINKYDFSSGNTVAVCIGADKLSAGEVVDCTKLDKIDIQRYSLNYLSKNNISIEEQALDYLIDATSGSMSNLVNELSKLSAYVGENATINMEIVTNLVSNTTDYVIYMLTAALDEKNFTKYQTILNSMSKSQSFAEIFAYMGKYFKRMQYVAINKNDDELAKILNIKPYAIKMSRQCISKNGVNYYINLYKKYVDLDYKIKSGKISVFNALYELLF